MYDRICRCRFCRAGRWAYTLVELLVVIVVIGILAMWAGVYCLRASRMEKNLRNEAVVRTQLALGLERIERQLSLAKGIDNIEKFKDGEGGLLAVSYPLEVGGVSLETNRVSRMFGLWMRWDASGLYTTISNRNDLLLPMETIRHTDAVPTLQVFQSPVPLTNVDIYKLADKDNLVSVSLSAAVPMLGIDDSTCVKTISVDRIVRLWNQ